MKVYKTIFILVPDKDKGKVEMKDFEFPLLGEVLVLGFSSFNYDVRKMLRSDLVVTVGEWHECENCNIAIQVARLMKQPIIHSTSFQNYVKQNYN